MPRQRLADLGARIAGELVANQVDDVVAPVALQAMEAFQQGQLARGLRRLTAEHVRVLELLEETHRILDAIYAKIERIDVPCVHLDGNGVGGSERARARKREIRLAFRLADSGRGGQEQRNSAEGLFQRMFHRYTPRKLAFPSTGRQRGCG